MTSNERLLYITEKMLETLRTRGWIQNAAVGPEGLCVMEAFLRVARDLPLTDWERLFSEFTGIHDLIKWNDEEGRTFTEIERTLSNFANHLRGLTTADQTL
jgi:hypothetical protein